MKRSITPIIAIVLLLLLTVAIATVTFFWISSMQVRIQQSPSGTVSSITTHGKDQLKVISVNKDQLVLQSSSDELINDTIILIDGNPINVNHTQSGQFHIFEWDVENVTRRSGGTDVDALIGNSSLSLLISGDAEWWSVFGSNCGNGYCKSGKESPNTCPEDCDVIKVAPVGGGARLSMSVFSNIHYMSLKYTTYSGDSLNPGNWSPSQTIVQFMNASEIDVAYDNYNRPIVFFAKRVTEGVPSSEQYYNLSYTFWDGSSWSPVVDLMSYFNNSAFPPAHAFHSVDVFNNDTAIFVWHNTTNSQGDAVIYYAIGNVTSVGAPQVAFTTQNLNGLAMRVDNNDRVIMIWSNGSYDSERSLYLSAIYYSIYNPTEAVWSAPKEALYLEHPSDVYGGPVFAFNSTNHGLLLFAQYDASFTPETDVFTWYSTWNGYEFTQPVDISDKLRFLERGGSLPQMAYGGLDKAVILTRCNASKFNEAYSSDGLCYNTFDGITFSDQQLVIRPEFEPDQVVVSAELLNNKHGSILGTWCAWAPNISYSIFVGFWNESGFGFEPGTIQAVETNLIENPESSCPFLYSWNGSDYVFEHESYGFAVFRGWEYTSHERLENLVPIDGLLKIKLSEELDEVSYTDSLILKAVEHDKDVEVLPDLEGNIHTIKEWVRPSSCVDYDNLNCLDRISGDGYWTTNFDNKDFSKDEDLRDGLIIEFDKPEGIVEPKLFLRLKSSLFFKVGGSLIIDTIGSNNLDYFYGLFNNPLIKGLVDNWRRIAELQVSVWTGSDWKEVDSFGVGGESWNDVLIMLPQVNTDSVMIKLESSSAAYLIDEAKIDYSKDDEIRIIELEPVSMIKNDGIDVMSKLISDDDDRVMLIKNQYVEALFKPVNEIEGKGYSYLTDINGYYNINAPPVKVKLDLSVYIRLAKLLFDPKIAVKEVRNKVLGINLPTGMEDVQLINSLSLLGIVAVIAVIIALI